MLFQLESLGKLRDVKSKTQGLTLLHYLALELVACESRLLAELKGLNSKVHEVGLLNNCPQQICQERCLPGV